MEIRYLHTQDLTQSGKNIKIDKNTRVNFTKGRFTSSQGYNLVPIDRDAPGSEPPRRWALTQAALGWISAARNKEAEGDDQIVWAAPASCGGLAL